MNRMRSSTRLVNPINRARVVALPSHLRQPLSTSFYSVDTPQADVREGTWITGTVLDHSVDVTGLEIGSQIDPPYETTVDSSFRDLWFSAFHSNDRVNVSTPFARRLGLQDAVLPMSLMLFLTGSMTHADSAKVQLGYRKATYHWPAFAKDSFTRSFTLVNKRDTSDGLHVIAEFSCVLRNQRGKVVFTTNKSMLYDKTAPDASNSSGLPPLPSPSLSNEHLQKKKNKSSDGEITRVAPAGSYARSSAASSSSYSSHYDDESVGSPQGGLGVDTGGGGGKGVGLDGWAPHALWQHLSESATRLSAIGESQSLTKLRPGQLILHSTCRPLSATQSMQLSSLARLTHARHFNHHVYNFDEIFIPGGLVLGLTLSAANRDLHEVLHENLSEVSFVHNVHPGDTVGALTFVTNLEENIAGNLEAVTLRTIGVKNVDVALELPGVALPGELFTGDVASSYRKEIEAICATKCPQLSGKIVCVVDRKVLRQAPSSQTFLL